MWHKDRTESLFHQRFEGHGGIGGPAWREDYNAKIDQGLKNCCFCRNMTVHP
jgi:hypothetical protein